VLAAILVNAVRATINTAQPAHVFARDALLATNLLLMTYISIPMWALYKPRESVTEVCKLIAPIIAT
jgi:hypothetical protein